MCAHQPKGEHTSEGRRARTCETPSTNLESVSLAGLLAGEQLHLPVHSDPQRLTRDIVVVQDGVPLRHKPAVELHLVHIGVGVASHDARARRRRRNLWMANLDRERKLTPRLLYSTSEHGEWGTIYALS